MNTLGWNVYTDGSFTAASDDSEPTSGWGIVVISPSEVVADYYGATCLDAASVDWIGARRHSNNVGELCAVFKALQYILDCVPVGSDVHLVYDSKYAANCAQRLWRAQSNLRLITSCADMVDRVDTLYALSWSWVRGHSRNQWNERADANAKLGSSGASATW